MNGESSTYTHDTPHRVFEGVYLSPLRFAMFQCMCYVGTIIMERGFK